MTASKPTLPHVSKEQTGNGLGFGQVPFNFWKVEVRVRNLSLNVVVY